MASRFPISGQITGVPSVSLIEFTISKLNEITSSTVEIVGCLNGMCYMLVAVVVVGNSVRQY